MACVPATAKVFVSFAKENSFCEEWLLRDEGILDNAHNIYIINIYNSLCNFICYYGQLLSLLLFVAVDFA